MVLQLLILGTQHNYAIKKERNTTYVMVLGYPPLPAWSLSDGCQAQQGLDTDVTMFHNWLSILQMAAPGAAI